MGERAEPAARREEGARARGEARGPERAHLGAHDEAPLPRRSAERLFALILLQPRLDMPAELRRLVHDPPLARSVLRHRGFVRRLPPLLRLGLVILFVVDDHAGKCHPRRDDDGVLHSRVGVKLAILRLHPKRESTGGRMLQDARDKLLHALRVQLAKFVKVFHGG